MRRLAALGMASILSASAYFAGNYQGTMSGRIAERQDMIERISTLNQRYVVSCVRYIRNASSWPNSTPNSYVPAEMPRFESLSLEPQHAQIIADEFLKLRSNPPTWQDRTLQAHAFIDGGKAEVLKELQQEIDSQDEYSQGVIEY